MREIKAERERERQTERERERERERQTERERETDRETEIMFRICIFISGHIHDGEREGDRMKG